jgi:hypothetical protein
MAFNAFDIYFFLSSFDFVARESRQEQ